MREGSILKQRYDYVDTSRGLAVLLAMLGHAGVQFAASLPTYIFTRTATPTFLVIFGIMIQLVYLRRLRETQDLPKIRRAFISRMMTCYLLFGTIAVAGLIGDKMTLSETVKAVTFTGSGRFGNILKLYALMFLILIPMLPYLNRSGWRPVMVIAALAWTVSLVLRALDFPAPYFPHMILGHGSGFGPAVLLSLFLVGYGMMIGSVLTGSTSWRLVALIFVISFIVLVVALIDQGPVTLVGNITTLYRATNDVRYYAFGIVSSTMSLLVFKWLWQRTVVDAGTRLLAVCGQQTLFIYGAGNVVLNLLPQGPGGPLIGTINVLIFLTTLVLVAYDRRGDRPILHRASANAFVTLGAFYNRNLEAFTVWSEKRLFGNK